MKTALRLRPGGARCRRRDPHPDRGGGLALAGAGAGGRWSVALQARDGGTPEAVAADAVVIAEGVWTTRIGRMMGAHLPTIPLALTMTVTMRLPRVMAQLVQHAGGRLSLKQALDGNILIGGGWPARLPLASNGEADLDAAPELLRETLAGNAAIRVLPELAEVPALRSWVGTTTIYP